MVISRYVTIFVDVTNEGIKTPSDDKFFCHCLIPERRDWFFNTGAGLDKVRPAPDDTAEDDCNGTSEVKHGRVYT